MKFFLNILKYLFELIIFPFFLIIYFFMVIPINFFKNNFSKKRKPKIIWGPTPIISINTNAEADRLFGYQSDTLVYRPYYVTNQFTYNLVDFWDTKILALFIPWAVFLWNSVKYDIFQFYFDGGFLNRTIGKGLEFPLLKLLGKKIIVSAYGADVRTGEITKTLGKYNCCMDCKDRLRACICDADKAKKNIAYINRYADVTLSMGDMIEYTPGSRNDIFYWAINTKKWRYIGVRKDSNPVTIIHAPNHPHFKGTRFLIDTVKELKEDGYNTELILIEKMDNEKAKKLYESADIIVDQLIIGWHGNFAVEGMALGKPVVCFIRKPEEYLPKWIQCPIINANPENLKEELVKLITNPNLRYELGLKGRKYVESVFSLEKVGERMDRIYKELWET